MVRPDIGNHMVRRVHAKLGEVVQLSGLARLDADTGIGVRRAIVCLVARVLRPLVAGSRPLVLALRPLAVPALYGTELLFIGRYTMLALVGPVTLGLSVRRFFVHGTDRPYFPQMFVEFLFRYLQLQGIHARVRLYRCRIDRLGMPADHALFDAHGQYLDEDFLEHRLREQLPRPAYGAVPWKFLVNVVTYEVQDVQPHRTMRDELAIADDVFQITYQAQFEEDHRIDALLAAVAIITLGKRVKEI